MRIEVVTPPETEPLSVADAKGYLRLDGNAEDALVGVLVTAAREHVEAATGRALAEQTLRLVLDRWPCGPVLPLPRPPLLAVESVKYLDENGEEQTWAAENYEVITAGTPGAIYAPAGWPATACRPGAVRVTFTAGYGAEEGEDVPQRLLVAIRLLVNHWFDTRTPVALGTISTEIPMSVETLLATMRFPYRLPEGAV